MNLIAVVDSSWGTGERGEFLTGIPEDMKFFRDTTIGNVIIVGRKTFEAFPDGKPLSERDNIVITRNELYDAEGFVICHSIEGTLEELKKHQGKDIYVVGGGSIYRQFLPYCNGAYITKVQTEYLSDTKLTNFDDNKEWRLVSESETKKWEDTLFSFAKYERVR